MKKNINQISESEKIVDDNRKEVIKEKLEKLSSDIYDEWSQIKWIKYYDKEKGEYLNGGYEGFKKDNPKCQEQDILIKELAEINKKEQEAEELAEAKERAEAKSRGQVIIYTDGVKYNRGNKWAIANEQGELIDRGVNTQTEWQIEGEAFAILKAVFWGIENKVKELLIRTDVQLLANGEDFKSKTNAGKYYNLARNKAKQENIKLDFEWVASTENKADKWSRF